MKLQLLLSKMLNFMGDATLGGDGADKNMPGWVYSILKPIFDVLKSFLLPVIIVLGIAGMIYAIVIGVQYARAESTDQKDAAKRRLINAIVGVVIMLVALIALYIFIMNANEIFGWVTTTAEKANQ